MRQGPVLVTGASGFVGSRLIQGLRGPGMNIHALTPDGQPLEGFTATEITRHRVDIAEASVVRKVMQKIEPETVFHLAAYGTFGNEKDVERMIRVNIAGTYHLLAACRDVGCRSFVYAGSAKEYPTTRVPWKEDQGLKPWDTYAATKAAANFFCDLAAQWQPWSVTTLRLSPVYGPGDSAARFMLTLIRAALRQEPFTLSVGSLVRNFVYIDDVVDAFLRAGKRTNPGYEAYNIGGSETHSFDDILATVERVTGRSIVKNVASPPSARDDSWVVDIAKARAILGWEPKVSLTEGIRRTVEWYHQTK